MDWGHKVKQIGEWTGSVAASTEEGEETEHESEREMDVTAVTRDC